MTSEDYLVICPDCGNTIWRTKPCAYCRLFRTRDDQHEHKETP